MKITQAKDIAAGEIYALLYETAIWVEAQCKGQWPFDWLEGQKEKIFHSISNGDFYVVYLEMELSAVVEVKSEPEAIWGYDRTSAYYVHKLAVRRKFEGIALGREILTDIFILAKENNISKIRLDCVSENKKLQEYYLSAGLKPVGSAFDEGTEVTLFEMAVE